MCYEHTCECLGGALRIRQINIRCRPGPCRSSALLLLGSPYLQHDTEPYGAVRCGAVRCGAVGWGAVGWGGVRCGPVPCRAVPCRAVPCRVVSCRAVSCRVVSYRIVSYRVVLYQLSTTFPLFLMWRFDLPAMEQIISVKTLYARLLWISTIVRGGPLVGHAYWGYHLMWDI